MTVGQLTTPRLPTSWPFTNQRWTGWSYAIAMCARLSVSARCGMASPHFALDIRLVNASLSNWACESQLIRPYLMSTPTPCGAQCTPGRCDKPRARVMASICNHKGMMSDAYRPVDLSAHCNAGVDLLGADQNPPRGDQMFQGLPFHIAPG